MKMITHNTYFKINDIINKFLTERYLKIFKFTLIKILQALNRKKYYISIKEGIYSDINKKFQIIA